MRRYRRNSKIWTKDFTILTMGSFVTYMGSSTTAYVLAFFVLELFDSVLMYSLYLSLYNAVRLITPLVAGTFLDRCSRKKSIYLINFTLAMVLFLFWIVSKNGYVQPCVFFVLVAVIGMAESSYRVSYKSFFPLLVKKENLPKANAVVTALETTSAVMIPIGTIIYKLIGVEMVLLVCAALFFIAGLIETHINQEERYSSEKNGSTLESYMNDFKEGIRYIINRKALLLIVICEFALSLIWGTQNTIILPFCNDRYNKGYLWYIVVSGGLMAGEFWGSCIMYFLKMPPRKTFTIFAALSIVPFFLISTSLYMPLLIMILINFLFGTTSAMTENMRFATSQAVLQEEIRGRFNGVYSTMTFLGMLLGELLVGFLSEVVPLIIVNLVLCGLAFAIQVICCVCGRTALKDHFEKSV